MGAYHNFPTLIMFVMLEFDKIHGVFMLVSPTMHELQMLPTQELYCAPSLHSTFPYVGTTLDVVTPLTIGDDNTIWYGGGVYFFCDISYFSHIEATQL